MSAEAHPPADLTEPKFEPVAQQLGQARSAPRESQLQYLYRVIDGRMKKREALATWYRRLNFSYQLAAAILSALITVITGMKTAAGEGLGIAASNVVLVVSAVVTLVTLAGRFYAPRELWVVLMGHCSDLQDLKTRIEFEERSPDFTARQDEVVQEGFRSYQALMDAYELRWREIREKDR